MTALASDWAPTNTFYCEAVVPPPLRFPPRPPTDRRSRSFLCELACANTNQDGASTQSIHIVGERPSQQRRCHNVHNPFISMDGRRIPRAMGDPRSRGRAASSHNESHRIPLQWSGDARGRGKLGGVAKVTSHLPWALRHPGSAAKRRRQATMLSFQPRVCSLTNVFLTSSAKRMFDECTSCVPIAWH